MLKIIWFVGKDAFPLLFQQSKLLLCFNSQVKIASWQNKWTLLLLEILHPLVLLINVFIFYLKLLIFLCVFFQYCTVLYAWFEFDGLIFLDGDCYFIFGFLFHIPLPVATFLNSQIVSQVDLWYFLFDAGYIFQCLNFCSFVFKQFHEVVAPVQGWVKTEPNFHQSRFLKLYLANKRVVLQNL